MGTNTAQQPTGSPHGDQTPPSGTTPGAGAAPSDLAGYVVACLILLVGGSTLRTPILNWICGPAIVVASVVFVGRINDRRAARRSGRSAHTDAKTTGTSKGTR